MVHGSTGVLNDFDLSAIMEPGASSPTRTDYERTGTKPFMAFDLLVEPSYNGVIPRLYRHELESFSWVLLWAGLCTRSISSPFDRWLAQNPLDVYDRKLGFISRLGYFRPANKTSLYDETASTLEAWLYFWVEIHHAFLDRLGQRRWASSREQTGCELVAQMINLMKVNGLDLPIEDSWLDVQILHVD